MENSPHVKYVGPTKFLIKEKECVGDVTADFSRENEKGG